MRSAHEKKAGVTSARPEDIHVRIYEAVGQLFEALHCLIRMLRDWK